MVNPNKSWAEEYRPKNINDIVFPDKKWRTMIEKWIEQKSIPGNVLLYGPGGFGKSTLARILISELVDNTSDFKNIESRSVAEVDSIIDFMKTKPLSSQKKIVLIEEADRLSSQAQTEIKNKFAEKYQGNASIIMATNYIEKIDKYLLQRFVYKMNFDKLHSDETFNRLVFILKDKNATYNEAELKNWIDENITDGLRNLINTLQLSFELNESRIIFSNINDKKDIEDKIIILSLDIIEKFMSCTDIRLKNSSYLKPLNSSIIGSQWTELTQIVHNNYGIDYSMIINDINNKIQFVPINKLCMEYLEDVDRKKYPHLHMLALLSDILKCVIEITC